ncbi:MAG: SRPBCC family protein [Steroidobacteraceae bacterium]
MNPLLLTAAARAFGCAVAMASLWSPSVSSAQPETQLRSFHLGAPRVQVFPLFTALGERAWAPGWDPVLLAGAEERGSAFRTKNHHGQETVWIVTDYRPAEGRVSYARLAYGSNIGLVDVICTEPPGGGTDVSVRYTLTALSEEARPFVRDFLNSEHYSQMIEEWRAALSSLVSRSAPTR